LLYRWHPAFDSEVDVLYEERRRGETVYVCLLPNDSGVVIPTWMFSAAACDAMKIGAPRASLGALNEVRAILSEIGFDRVGTAARQLRKEPIDANARTEGFESSDTTRPTAERKSNHKTGRQQSFRSGELTGTTSARSRAKKRRGGGK
jgi:hypothetical protein